MCTRAREHRNPHLHTYPRCMPRWCPSSHKKTLSDSVKKLHKHFRCNTWEVLFPIGPNHPSHKQPESRTVSNFSQKQGYLAWLQLKKTKSNYTQTFKWMLWTWQTGRKAAYMHIYSRVLYIRESASKMLSDGFVVCACSSLPCATFAAHTASKISCVQVIPRQNLLWELNVNNWNYLDAPKLLHSHLLSYSFCPPCNYFAVLTT